jgi:hypothetical protein
MPAFGRVVQRSFAEFVEDVKLMAFVDEARYFFNVAVRSGEVQFLPAQHVFERIRKGHNG